MKPVQKKVWNNYITQSMFMPDPGQRHSPYGVGKRLKSQGDKQFIQANKKLVHKTRLGRFVDRMKDREDSINGSGSTGAINIRE